jgi:MFS superfamily sulfate permease-like transporter
MATTFLSTLFISLEIGVAVGFLASFLVLRNTKKSTFKSIITVFSQNYKKDILFNQETESDQTAHLDINDNLHFGNAYYLKDVINKEIIRNNQVKEIEICFKNDCDMDSSALKALRESVKAINLKNKTYTIINTNQKLNTRLKNARIKQTNILP